MIKLQDKLYTSTEVAQILGVSLRSVYRYIEEDKLTAEVKTATGRHRFTKQDILDFLYPHGVKEDLDEDTESRKTVPTSPVRERESVSMPRDEEYKEEVQEEAKEEEVDWLSKFREAASKFREEEEKKDVPESPEEEVEEEIEVKGREDISGLSSSFKSDDVEERAYKANGKMVYYRSSLGGLKDIAQSIDKNARESNLDYAFTLNAGLSLHAPIQPFSILHAYVRSSDQQYFEKLLSLTPSDQESAQLCLLPSDEDAIYESREELHGLYVASKEVLQKDVEDFGDDSLKEEVANIFEN